jgi:hypothetical protein
VQARTRSTCRRTAFHACSSPTAASTASRTGSRMPA